MTTLFLDISDGNARVLLTEGYRLVDLRTLDIFGDGAGIGDIIARVYSATGQKIKQAHLILPDEAVHAEVCKLQKMSLDDARKVMQRQIEGSAGRESIVHLTEMAGTPHQLVCLVESVDKSMIERYREAFAAENIKISTITSNLQSLLAAFSPLRESIENVEIVFHLGSKSITALFFSNRELLHHEHIPVESPETPQHDAEDPVRSLKRRQFSVLTPLHSVYSSFMRENPDVQVDKVWLCGPFEGIEGVAESLTEATGLAVLLADHIADFEEGSCAFTALAGLLQTQDNPQRANFIPQDMLKPVTLRPGFLFRAALGLVVLCAFAVVAFTEFHLFKLKAELGTAKTELSALELSAQMSTQHKTEVDFLTSLNHSSLPFYEIFRELANMLPAEIMLEGLRFDNSSGKPVLHVSATTDYEAFNDRSSLLSALVNALSQSTYLADYSDPVIEIIGFGDKKRVQITLSCGVAEEKSS